MKSPNWDILQACEFFALLSSYLFLNVCIRRDEADFKHVSREGMIIRMLDLYWPSVLAIEQSAIQIILQ